MSNTRPRGGRGKFRARSVTQHAEPRQLKPSARELFRVLRPRLLGSRPLVKKERIVKGRLVAPAVYGKPSFRNVIDPETGAHV